MTRHESTKSDKRISKGSIRIWEMKTKDFPTTTSRGRRMFLGQMQAGHKEGNSGEEVREKVKEESRKVDKFKSSCDEWI